MYNKKYITDHYKKNYKIYRKAAELTNVPPHFLASLHYREHAFGTNSPGPGGPMQFDPPLQYSTIQMLLTKFTSLDTKAINSMALKGQDNFFIAIVLAGCFIQNKLKQRNLPPLRKEMNHKGFQILLMKAFELYNGTAYGSPWKSPYVCNFLDSKHMDMRIRGTYIDRYGTRRRVNTKDKRPGAYTVFKQLDSEFAHNWS